MLFFYFLFCYTATNRESLSEIWNNFNTDNWHNYLPYSVVVTLSFPDKSPPCPTDMCCNLCQRVSVIVTGHCTTNASCPFYTTAFGISSARFRWSMLSLSKGLCARVNDKTHNIDVFVILVTVRITLDKNRYRY